MLELFRAEVEEHGAVLSEGLLNLEGEGASPAAIEPLMRAAHSIKGAARIVALEAVQRVAHATEDCLVAAGEGRVELGGDEVDTLLAGLDLVNRIASIDEAELEGWLETHAEEVEILVWRIITIHDPDATPGGEEEPAEGGPSAPVEEAPVTEAPPPSPATVSSQDLSGLSMLELFREEVETHAATLSDGLLALEQSAGTSADYESLMRAAHSVKGAARIVSLDPVVEVAHTMEDCFVAAQEGRVEIDADGVDALLAGLDLITRVAALDDQTLPSFLAQSSGEVEARVAAISALLEPGERPASVAPPPTPAPPPTSPAPARRLAPSAAAERPATPSAASSAAGRRGGELRDLRISAESLSRLMGLAGESVVASGWLEPFSLGLRELKKRLVEAGQHLEALRVALEEGADADLDEPLDAAATSVARCQEALADRALDLDTFTRRSIGLSDRLYRQVLSSRMRPFVDGVHGFRRLVRDLARSLGKKVRLEIVGGDTEVDRDILDKLEAPLNHLIRNAVDHGIEASAERVAAGKEEAATITIEARHASGRLLVTVADDGRGIDEARLRAKIVERGLADPELAAKVGSSELLDFLFLPGFSTSDEVTEISGRGVGLDVVQSMVQEVGGELRAESTAGEGVVFSLLLPVTRSVIRVLLVEVSGEPLAFPLARIDHTLIVPDADLRLLENRHYFAHEGVEVGLVDLREVLELPAPTEAPDEHRVVVVSDRSGSYGVVVDRFVGERDVVVHPLDERLGKVPDLTAVALTEDGSPVLIVDVDDMVRSVETLLTEGRLRRGGGEEDDRGRRKRILVVEDSVTVREVERQTLENAGYEVDVAVDGMDGWNAVRSVAYDLVLSDVDMPRMTGIELVTRIKGEARLASIPVVIVSYKDREQDRLKGLEAGADYYLTKSSFQDQTMLNAVRDLIGGPSG